MQETNEFFGMKGFRKKADCEIKEIMLEAVEKRIEDTALNAVKHYSVHKASLGKGTSHIFVFTSPNEKILLGDDTLWLKHLKAEETQRRFFSNQALPRKIIEKICKEVGISLRTRIEGRNVPRSDEELITDIFATNEAEPLLFVLTNGLPIEELLKLNDASANRLIRLWLEDGHEKDEVILLIFKTGILVVNPALIKKTELVAPFQDHAECFSNTKTGKSFTAKKVGTNLSRASVPNLLGFATGNEINRGSLDGEFHMVTLDEMQEEKNIDMFGKLLNIMEEGEAVISVGKKRIRTRFYGPFRFVGNPKDSEEADIQATSSIPEKMRLALKKVEMLKKSTLNYQAYGSRIGFIVFDTNLMTSEFRGQDLILAEKDALTCIILTLRQAVKDKFTELFFNAEVRNWLNKSFDKKYKEQVKKLSVSVPLQPIKEFMKGHLDSYRHLRGMALRLAVIEKIISFWRGETGVPELLSIANKKFSNLCALNIKSFRNLSEAIDEETFKTYFADLVETLPVYQKVLVKSIIEWAIKNENEIDGRAVLTNAQLHNSILSCIHEENSTMSVNRVWDLIFRDTLQAKKDLREFGLGFEEIGNVRSIIIERWNPIKGILSISKENKVIENSKNETDKNVQKKKVKSL